MRTYLLRRVLTRKRNTKFIQCTQCIRNLCIKFT